MTATQATPFSTTETKGGFVPPIRTTERAECPKCETPLGPDDYGRERATNRMSERRWMRCPHCRHEANHRYELQGGTWVLAAAEASTTPSNPQAPTFSDDSNIGLLTRQIGEAEAIRDTAARHGDDVRIYVANQLIALLRACRINELAVLQAFADEEQCKLARPALPIGFADDVAHWLEWQAFELELDALRVDVEAARSTAATRRTPPAGKAAV